MKLYFHNKHGIVVRIYVYLGWIEETCRDLRAENPSGYCHKPTCKSLAGACRLAVEGVGSHHSNGSASSPQPAPSVFQCPGLQFQISVLCVTVNAVKPS